MDDIREQLTEALSLKPGAGDADILGRVKAWAGERKQQQTAAAFEARIANLVRVTNMPRQQAAQCLAEQDAAARTATA
jgi:hypothetical protein